MNQENDTLTPGSADDLDEPYVQTVSTEELWKRWSGKAESRTMTDQLLIQTLAGTVDPRLVLMRQNTKKPCLNRAR